MTTRYAVVGLGSRSENFTHPLLTTYASRGSIVGYCDVNQARMDYWNARYAKSLQAKPVPTYLCSDFERMVRVERPDVVIVTSVDRTHHTYICRAMELGCDVISEKPMTIDERKCQQVLDTIAATGRKLTVTFNYRYAPRASKVKELLMSGVIGKVLSVHFEWLLNTSHGADYFRRWHRDKRNSGGLMVHKATHHFDIINWWLGTRPKTVYGIGDLVFYGRDNAEARGETRFYDRGTTHPNAANDPFALHLDQDPELKALYLDAECEDGYRRDQSVFDSGISIEDDMAVLVQYASGATMSYHLTAYSPWEGHRVMLNGTKGRIEYTVEENSYVSGSQDDHNRSDLRNMPGASEWLPDDKARILVRPLWGKPVQIEVEEIKGGHGGADVGLIADIFGEAKPDPLGRKASHVDGAWSILTGIAANKSFATGQPVDCDSLVRFHEDAANMKLPATAASKQGV